MMITIFPTQNTKIYWHEYSNSQEINLPSFSPLQSHQNDSEDFLKFSKLNISENCQSDPIFQAIHSEHRSSNHYFENQVLSQKGSKSAFKMLNDHQPSVRLQRGTLIGKSSISRRSLFEDYNQNQDQWQLQQSCPLLKKQESNEIREEKRFKKTKNALRDIGNKFITHIYHSKRVKSRLDAFFKSQNILHFIKNIENFKKYLSELKLQNFSQFRQTFGESQNSYHGLMRILMYDYLRNQCYCDIFNSQLVHKQVYNELIGEILEGVICNPNKFRSFRKRRKSLKKFSKES